MRHRADLPEDVGTTLASASTSEPCATVQVFRKMSDEEKKALQTFVIDGMPRVVDEIKSRRKKKGDFQYEVSWKNLPSIKYNKWFMREVRPCLFVPALDAVVSDSLECVTTKPRHLDRLGQLSRFEQESNTDACVRELGQWT